MNVSKALFIVYFGEVPSSVKLSLKTLIKNDVDIYFFSEKVVDINTDNGRLIQYKVSKSIFNKLVKDKMGFNPGLKEGYKLCDFKVFFPLIFKDYVKHDYDYYGFCDVDVVYGFLDKVIDDSISSRFNVIGSRGHFMLMDKKTIDLVYSCLIDNENLFVFVKSILCSKFNFAFDEFKFFHLLLARLRQQGKLKWDLDFSMNAFDIDYFRKELYCFNRAKFASLIFFDNEFDLNVVFNDRTYEKVVYVHYQKRPFPANLESESLSAPNSSFSRFRMYFSRGKYKIISSPFWKVLFMSRKFKKLIEIEL